MTFRRFVMSTPLPWRTPSMTGRAVSTLRFSAAAERRPLQPVLGQPYKRSVTERSLRLNVCLFELHPRQLLPEYQSNTRKARSVFHRLGQPSTSSISIGVSPG